MSIGKKLQMWSLVLIAGFIPYLVVQLMHPSLSELESQGGVKAGRVTTASGNQLDVFLMMGDVFAPKKTRRDIGFDLVGVSCFFDPIQIENDQVLITNPLLFSALAHSARDSSEYFYFVRHLFESLEASRQVVACFLAADGMSRPCQGDQLTPYVWATYDKSEMSHVQGVKYVAALPMFDPSLFLGRTSEKDLHKRLGINIETVVRRLVGYSVENLQPTVHTIGLAALGSTSHSGGDSPAFLTFREGFLTSLQGITTSKTPLTLDRVFFVGFDEHSGVFRQETLQGLQSIADYLILTSVGSASGTTIAVALYSILWLSISFLLYQNVGYIWREKNRWHLIATLSAPIPIVLGLTLGVPAALLPMVDAKDYAVVYWVGGLMTAVSFLALSVLGRRLARGASHSGPIQHGPYRRNA